MASKKRPEKEPLYRSQEEMLTHIQKMTMGKEKMKITKAALEAKENLSVQEQGHLRYVNKITKRISQDIETACTEILDNLELDETQLPN